MSDFRIRASTPEDVPEIFGMIYELAEYENSAHEVQSNEELLHASLFADDPAVWCSILEHTDGDAASDDWAIAGFCIWFKNYFTWTAKHSIYLDDLYVREQYRGRGYGKALLQHLASICVERGYPRLDWWVLDWNPAVEFYRSIGALSMDEWTVNRLTGPALERLARGDLRRDPEAVDATRGHSPIPQHLDQEHDEHDRGPHHDHDKAEHREQSHDTRSHAADDDRLHARNPS